MAAHVEVVSTDFRRAKIRVTPGTYLVDVLDEACQKLNLKSDNYLLKHKQKPVDLSYPFRTSGLVSGAKLELVRKSSSPSVVSIALDIDGRRLTQKLPSDMSLWQVLRQFESADAKVNITARATPKTGSGNDSGSGQLYYEKPVVNIMGKEYSKQEELQRTLSQCGINSGSIALRVIFQKTDQTLYDTMQQIDQYLNQIKPSGPEQAGSEPSLIDLATPTSPDVVPPVESKKEEASVDGTEPAPVPQQEPTAPAPSAAPEPTIPQPTPSAETGDLMDFDQPPAVEDAATTTDGGHLQPTAIFSAPTSSTPAATKFHEDDAVYEPTIAHAQLRQQQLLTRAQNTRLKSDAELAEIAAQEAQKLAKINKVEVKVRFPDQTSVHWEVHPDTTGSTLYQSIRDVMASPEQPFKLVMSVTKATIHENNKRLIADYRLKGRELLNLVWEDAATDKARNAPFLKDDVASKAQAVVVREVPQEEKHDQPSGEASSSTANKSTQKTKGEPSHMDPEVLKKKLGKLFKLPGKK
ncbi:GLUT4 regulating protein TUG domain containing protein [Rhypophila decipiens]